MPGSYYADASGLDFIAKTTTVETAPTVLAVTAVTTTTTSYPDTTATTFASCDVCGCESPDTYCWNPPATAATPGPLPDVTGICAAGGTVTETVTAAGVTAAGVTTTVTAAGVTAAGVTTTITAATATITSTLAGATVTAAGATVTDTATSFVTVSGLGYNASAVTVTAVASTSTVTVTADASAATVTVTASHNYNSTVTSTATAVTSGVTVTETVTASACSTSSSSASSSSSSVLPTLSCDKYGYLIQGKALYQVDLSTGDYTAVSTDVGTPANVNAMGYNVLDNYLYAHSGGDNALRRISVDGTSEVVAIMDDTITGLIGDIDTAGSYWYATASATSWYEYDLVPGSSTYATVLSSGTTTAPGRQIFDWVVIPSTGRFLWTIGTVSPNGGADLMKWSMDTHTWTVVKNYPSITTNQFGALYGIDNGTIYASDNANGYIWSFNTDGTTDPVHVSDGPVSSQNDGARCVLNTDV